MSRKVTTIDAVLVALMVISIIVSGISLIYVTGLAATMGDLATRVRELTTAEKDLTSVVADLGKAVGAYAERIKAIEERVRAVEEGLIPPPLKVVISSGYSYGMATLYVAMANNFFEKEMPRLTVEPLYFVTGKEASDALMAGRSAMCLSGLMPGVTVALTAPGRFAVVGPIADFGASSKLIVIADIKTPEDLKGKRIAFKFGSDAHIWLLMILEKYGLKMEDIQMVNMGPPDMPAAFYAGSVDGVVCWDPYASKAQESVPGAHDMTKVYPIVVPIFNVYSMSREFINSHFDAAVAIMRALVKANNWIINNRDKAADIIANTTGWKKEDILTSIQPVYRLTHMISLQFMENMDITAKFLYDQGLVKNYLKPEAFVDMSVMKEAAPDLVKPTEPDPVFK